MGMVMYLLHIVGALSMGFYLILPFVVGKIRTLSSAAQEGTFTTLRSLNKVAQYGLIIQLLTGGYLMTKGEYSHLWMTIVVLLLLAIAAIGGIMGKPLRLAAEGARSNQDVRSYQSKISTFSALLAVFLLVMVYLMVNPGVI
ncbi:MULTISPECIES: hypothetical protein [Paenibacillus]|uniref:hypothetical protein n=1 Tax=Paenibacillus TaxID=44249 RepID=UPI001F34F3CC|nr:hypothetical protein [Paenibacillus sp. JJ-223]CAH1226062.1 hypothetical protein PAECIP111890_05887 [Paenibacillus sp. JJ-223]